MENDETIDDELVEAYCVRCRETVYIEDPLAVWTRKGTPAVRGECSVCGGTVFRMGKSPLHDALKRPSAVRIAGSPRMKLPQETVYVNFAAADSAAAARLADDLQRLGVACWMHQTDLPDVNGAGGVQSSLHECMRMVLVLSTAALGNQSVEAAWRFFRSEHKPVVIAQIAPIDPPDALRRRPRFDFTLDYKRAFRQLFHELTS